MTPWLPPGAMLSLAGRGEVFYRHHRHADPSAPTLLLLHGWTADADTQFFSAYEALAERSYPRVARRALARMVGVGNEELARWIAGELRRNDPVALVQAVAALRRYDARPFAGTIDRPAAVLITTRDHLVRPAKQWALARALGAYAETLAADHLCTITDPAAYSAATRRLVDRVVDDIGGAGMPAVAAS